jgi:hypothetical protein
MTASSEVQSEQRGLVSRCVGEAYEVLELIPGVNPNGPALVWLAERFLEIERADWKSPS